MVQSGMKKIPEEFIIGTATAAHQVEGDNSNSDVWVMEHAKNSFYVEPSLNATEHYQRFREDIDLMAEAGLKAYRFSLEWSRIEPENGMFEEKEIAHYREVLKYCHDKKITPIVTLHHFTSPVWLIREGGWKSEKTIKYFERYCRYVMNHLGDLIPIVCTINEANMGYILGRFYEMLEQKPEDDSSETHIQIGMNPEVAQMFEANARGMEEAFGMEFAKIAPFLGARNMEEEKIVMLAHNAARRAIKEICPEIKVGITFSLTDYQAEEGAEEEVEKLWDYDFCNYLPYLQEDDFIGVQNYTRKIILPDGNERPIESERLTKFGTENYPASLGNVIRKVYAYINKPILVTENGISTDDDEQRIHFIHDSLLGVLECIEDAIPVQGFIYWSLMDNFEWQNGYNQNFGLMGIDRKMMERQPRKSLTYLGNIAERKVL